VKDETTPTKDTGALTPKRAVAATATAIVLVLAGTAVWRLGIYDPIRQAPERAEDRAAAFARADAEAREAYFARANQRAKDPQVAPVGEPTGATGYFAPPRLEDMPDGPWGESVRRGHQIFVNTQTNAADFVGNGMNCVNCHIDAGREEHAAPMWAAATQYPAWRSKNAIINTMEDRIHGCFTYSMNAQASPNGEAPPRGHDIYKDLESYFFWLAEGAPLAVDQPGRGYPVPPEPEDGFDVARGQTVFEANCAVCHGADGQGRQDLNGRWIFPALWGDNSYNWGAGMHRIDTAAGFIWANMPYGKRFHLTPQEAWDVSAYMNSHERPPDPRQIRDGMSVEETRERFHARRPNYYGEVVNGDLLGDGVPGSTVEHPPRIVPKEQNLLQSATTEGTIEKD